MVDWTYLDFGLSTDRGLDCLAQRLAGTALMVTGHPSPHAGMASGTARHHTIRPSRFSFTAVYPVNMDAEGPLSSLSYSGVAGQSRNFLTHGLAFRTQLPMEPVAG